MTSQDNGNKPTMAKYSPRCERMTGLALDALLAVQEACTALGVTLDGSERQDLVSTLIIHAQRQEEMDRRWPARKHREIDIGDNPPNSQAAADYVAQQKIAQLQQQQVEKKPPAAEIGTSSDGRRQLLDPENPRPWHNLTERDAIFEQLREQLGDTRYFAELSRERLPSHKLFKSWQQGLRVYKQLASIVMVEQTKGVA